MSAYLKPKDINLFLGKVYKQVTGSKDLPQEAPKRDLILFVGKVFPSMIKAVHRYEKEHKQTFRVGLLNRKKGATHKPSKTVLEQLDLVLECDFHSAKSIQKTVQSIRGEIFSVVTRGDDNVPLLAKLIPHIPYITTPTVESLKWATEKIAMRNQLKAYDPSLVPPFMVVKDATKKTLDIIEKEISFPLIVKPSGLGASRLVSICYHREELQSVLAKAMKALKQVYKKTDGRGEPEILVEAFMEGSMYSVDGYVDGKGRITFCPAVFVKTGREIGFDDFFGYRQMSPTILKKENLAELEATAAKAIHALGLRHVTAHVELMRLESGWQIIELGPRVGGFRHELHEYTHGINHTMNDVLIRAGERPLVPKKQKGYAVAMKFFPRKEGRLAKVTGIKKMQELKSFKKVNINAKTGDMCRYAKNGGSSVFNVILANTDRSKLLADIRRLEQMIHIETE